MNPRTGETDDQDFRLNPVVEHLKRAIALLEQIVANDGVDPMNLPNRSR